MLKNLQKSLMVASIFTIPFASQAQDAVESFNVAGGWTTLQNYPNYTGPNPPTATECYTGATPGGPTITADRTYGSTTITYTLYNAGVNPFCGVRGPNPANPPVNGAPKNLNAIGFVELGKWFEGGDANTALLAGSITTSAFPYLESINLRISATGGNRKVGLSYSTNDGVDWEVVFSNQETAIDDSLITKVQGDSIVDLPIQKSNVRLKLEAGKDRIRIHDISYFFTPLSIEKSTSFANGATVSVIDNRVTVKSPTSGSVQIVSYTGVLIGQKDVQAGAEATVDVPSSGLYIVRLNSSNQIFTKKIAVQ